MDAEALAGADRFAVLQRVAPGVHRYEIRALDPAGRPGALLAYARERRLSLRGEVTFWTGPDRRTPVLSLRARRRLDLGARYDVTDAAGRPLATLRRDVLASLTRSTWHLRAHGVTAVGRERDPQVALLRRAWGMLPGVGTYPSPFPAHLDFTDTQTGVVVMTSEQERGLRDRYRVTIPGGVLDGRVAAATAVALDLLQPR